MEKNLQGDDLLRALKLRAGQLQAAAKQARMALKRGAALNIAAREQGFRDWNAASGTGKKAASQLTSRREASRQLPAVLMSILEEAAKLEPSGSHTQEAFKQGFAFAMDVKDAEQLRSSDAFAACDDGWYLAAQDIWPRLVNHVDDESGLTLSESLELSELQEIALDDLQNYRLFRFVEMSVPATLSDAYALVSKHSFFAPTHIWLGGACFNLAEVPEIRVDGEVVYSTVQKSEGGIEAPAGTEAAKLWHLLNDAERRLFASMPVERQSFMLHEARKRTPYGQGRFKPLHVSVTMPFGDADAKKTRR